MVCDTRHPPLAFAFTHSMNSKEGMGYHKYSTGLNNVNFVEFGSTLLVVILMVSSYWNTFLFFSQL